MEDNKEYRYTRKIQSPIYEPKNIKPQLSDIYDTTKRDILLLEINKSNQPEIIKDFLRSAAERHTAFNFTKIADYYAHSSPDLKNMLEDSALVILDYDKAVRLGFAAYEKDVYTVIDDLHKKEFDEWN